MLRLSVQSSPVEGKIEIVRLTFPLNPSRLLTVIVELPILRGGIVTVVGLAVTAKSITVMAMVKL